MSKPRRRLPRSLLTLTPDEERWSLRFRLAAIGTAVTTPLVLALWGVLPLLAFTIVAGVYALLAATTIATVGTRMRRQYQRARDDLRRRACRVCPTCGYELTELPIEGLCSECGSDYTPVSLKKDWEATYRRLLGAS